MPRTSKRSYRKAYPRLYRRYPEHGLGEPGTQLSKREVRAAAELAGFSPAEAKQVEQITRGESNRRPGIRGDDPGGTKGWGLMQNTPGVWGAEGVAYMNKLGGEKALRNPIKNMKMAKFLYDSAGKSFSPWYGTKFLQGRDPNAKSVLDKSAKFGRARTPGKLVTTTSKTPGVDLSADRQALKMNVLTTALGQGRMPSQSELLGLGSGLRDLQDIPGETSVDLEFRPGQRAAGGAGNAADGARTATGASVNKLFRKAKKWAKAAPAYLWGGGHGAIAKVGDRVDCSGFVSAMTGVPAPMVASQFKSWGKPGKGRHMTVYAADGHVFMSIRKRGKERFFGTSGQGSNPGGGVTEFRPSASYLKGFVARHPG